MRSQRNCVPLATVWASAHMDPELRQDQSDMTGNESDADRAHGAMSV